MHPVGLDGVVRSADHHADVVGVVVRAVEVRVVTNEDRDAHLDISSSKHGALTEGSRELLAACGKETLYGFPHFDTCVLAKLHELVERGLTEDGVFDVLHDRAYTE